MNATLLKLLGADGTLDADAVGDLSLRLTAPSSLTTVAVLGTLFAIAAWLLYRRSPKEVRPARRWLLTTLRASFLVLLAFLLLRPILTADLVSNRPKTLVVAIDQSSSFDLTDLGDSSSSRSKIATNATNALTTELGGSLEIVTVPFSRSTADPAVRLSPIGDTLLDIASRYPADSLASILLVSDGNNTAGTSPEAAADRLVERRVTVHTLGVGATSPPDLAVASVEIPDVALADDRLTVTARLRTSGLSGETVRVVAQVAGVEAASASVTLTDAPEQSVDLTFIPNAPGDFPIELSVEGTTTELLPDNNTAPASLRVVDTAMKVLLVDQAPRWEFKYIEAMLLREARVDLDVVLLEADRAVALVPGSPYIESFPALPEDLFAYDLIILGDVDPRQLSPSALDLLSDYVARTGGALAIVAGKRFMPAAYRHTALEPVLPVTIRPAALTGTTASATRPARLEPTRAGLASTMLKIGNSVDVAADWRTLPPIYWTADIESTKPAAEVLVTREGGSPVITLHRFGSGEVLFVGTDNTWRWRKNQGDATHTRFWGQVVQRLAGHRLSGGPRNLRIETTQREYAPGDRITVLAQIHDSAWNPIDSRDLRATLTNPTGSTPSRTVTLSPVPDRPGFFRTEINADHTGSFSIALPGSPATPARFSVRSDNPEHAQLALNEPVLKAVAERTGGTYLTPESLLTLAGSLTTKKSTITTNREFDLWSAPLTIIILISLITTEWILRKFTELK